mmetsp:Transcript_17342/g.42378  ORF Transcript_17342/g.42378 Transcript_17342/m.42378 type:complete len:248 (-) Transcript_17342:2589-3332(-)
MLSAPSRTPRASRATSTPPSRNPSSPASATPRQTPTSTTTPRSPYTLLRPPTPTSWTFSISISPRSLTHPSPRRPPPSRPPRPPRTLAEAPLRLAGAPLRSAGALPPAAGVTQPATTPPTTPPTPPARASPARLLTPLPTLLPLSLRPRGISPGRPAGGPQLRPSQDLVTDQSHRRQTWSLACGVRSTPSTWSSPRTTGPGSAPMARGPARPSALTPPQALSPEQSSPSRSPNLTLSLSTFLREHTT